MPTTISSTVTGIAGFDVTNAVDGLLALKKLEITNLKNRQTTETDKQTAFTQLQTDLTAFRSTATAMADKSAFFSYAASLSSSTVTPASSIVSISGSSSVAAGKHTIAVTATAKAESLSSNVAVKDINGTAITSDTTALGLSGSFTVAGATVTVNNTDSLQDVAANINQINTGASATGVTASIIKVGNSDFRLVLTADATGAAGFTLAGAALDASPTAGSLANLQIGATGTTNARTPLVAPADASVKIDGLTITRSSNTISDALKGVVLNLKQAPTDGAVVTMDIAVDTVALQSNVQAFVDAYNKVQKSINDQFAYDPTTGTSGLLAGESLLTTIQSRLTNTLFQTVPGLTADRNSLTAIGVEPDKTGQLLINPTLFGNLLNTNPIAIRDVFVANGTFTNNQFQFITNGSSTPSGTYPVNITTAATKGNVTSTVVASGGPALTAGGGVLGNDTITIIDTGSPLTFANNSSQRKSVVTLTAGMQQAAIVSALNTDFNTVVTEAHTLTNSSIVDGNTLLTALGTGMATGNSINITGTTRQGVAVNSSFTVGATDTVSTLLSSIQSAFNQGVVATVAAGKIILTDTQSGDSQLTFSITSAITPSPPTVFGQGAVTEGRFAMGLTAVASAQGIRIESNNYGTGHAFSITQTNLAQGANPANFDYLGIPNNTNVTGVDVAGTIGGQAANGSGQLLMGTSGNTNNVGVLFTGSSPAINSLVLGMGAAAQIDGQVQIFADPFTGLLQNNILASQSSFDTITSRIADLTAQMERQRVTLTQSFSQMQTLMASFQKTGNFLSQLSGIQSARTG